MLNSATLNLDLVLLNKRKVYCGVPTCNFQILGVGDSLTPTSSTTYNQLAIFNNEFITFKEDALIPVMLPRVHSLPENEEDPTDLPYKLPYLLQSGGVKFCLQNELTIS